jgi:hypothetical protein
MNRSNYFNLCEDRLAHLSARVELRGKLNILDLNIHCEDFYVHFFNLLFGYSLVNVNQTSQNVEGIDLVDDVNKIVLQVSSTATKQKVESALSKDLAKYKGYRFSFISISKDASSLRDSTFKNPHALVFDPKSDIHDVQTILKLILHMDIVRQKVIYDFLSKELVAAGVVDAPVETNIAAVINVLAKEDLSDTTSSGKKAPFVIDKKIEFNNLEAAASVVEEYKIHHGRLDRIYGEFDAAGLNRSKSVLDSLFTSYVRLSVKYSADELFFQIVDATVTKVKASANFVSVPLDQLELCVNILAVDAFIRCRIFKNPGLT